MNDEVKKLLGALEMIQELRTCCKTSQTIPVDYYWEKIRFSKDKDSKEFMGKFELEDISDWAELYVNTERIVKCPYCRKENSIDVHILKLMIVGVILVGKNLCQRDIYVNIQ